MWCRHVGILSIITSISYRAIGPPSALGVALAATSSSSQLLPHFNSLLLALFILFYLESQISSFAIVVGIDGLLFNSVLQ